MVYPWICWKKSGGQSAPLAAWGVSWVKILNRNLERLVKVKQIVALLWSRSVWRSVRDWLITTLGTTAESKRVPSLLDEPHTHIYVYIYTILHLDDFFHILLFGAVMQKTPLLGLVVGVTLFFLEHVCYRCICKKSCWSPRKRWKRPWSASKNPPHQARHQCRVEWMDFFRNRGFEECNVT